MIIKLGLYLINKIPTFSDILKTANQANKYSRKKISQDVKPLLHYEVQ